MLISKVTCIAFKVYILSVISFLGNQIHEFEVTSSIFYRLGYCYTLQISKYMPEIPNAQSDWQAQSIYDWLKHIFLLFIGPSLEFFQIICFSVWNCF